MMSPYAFKHFAPITPEDSTEIGPTLGVTCSGAGNLSVVNQDGATVTIAVAAGQWLPINVRIIRSTGTTATGIVAYYG